MKGRRLMTVFMNRIIPGLAKKNKALIGLPGTAAERGREAQKKFRRPPAPRRGISKAAGMQRAELPARIQGLGPWTRLARRETPNPRAGEEITLA